MPITVDQDSNTQLLVFAVNELIEVLDGVSLTVAGEDALVEAAGVSGNELRIAGFVSASGDGSAAVRSRGTGTNVAVLGDSDPESGEDVSGDIGIVMAGRNGELSNQGGVFGSSIGLLVTGPNVIATNSGVIDSDGTAVELRPREGIARLNNGGVIEGNEGIFVEGRADIGNFGVIEVSNNAVEFSSGKGKGSEIENTGKIIVGDGGIAVRFGAGDDLFSNGNGLVSGRILLGDGDDQFSSIEGEFDTVEGGRGKDVYDIDGKSGVIIEKAKGGIDLVRLFGDTYTLDANVENLVIRTLGSGDGFGNEGDNRITGNAFSNSIGGLEGNDILTGKGGEDTFRFFTGHGKDVITDYKPGVDGLNFEGWEAIEDFEDLIGNHTTVKGKDLIFKAGADSLTLKGVGLDEIDETDFNFVI